MFPKIFKSKGFKAPMLLFIAMIMSEEIWKPMQFSYHTRKEYTLVGIEYKENEINENDE